ncbi:transposase [Candidatus Bathyarchaeota archaeon]|nr:transposase [Candidatus Bathyarchaeota archaeon]
MNLHDTEETISQPHHKTGTGKPPRSPLGIFKALTVQQLRNIPSDREHYRRLWNDEAPRTICDIEDREKPNHPPRPTRFRNRVGRERLEDIMTGLLEELVEEGVVKVKRWPWVLPSSRRGAGGARRTTATASLTLRLPLSTSNTFSASSIVKTCLLATSGGILLNAITPIHNSVNYREF